MKQIALRKFADFTTAEILKAVMENNPHGMNAAEIRRRIRVLDVIETADKAGTAAFRLEDADHATLSGAVNAFQFSKASRDLITIIDDVTEAKPVTSDEPQAAA